MTILKISNKGITLIALVITIIVLLILAGITIAMLTGENGLLNRSSTSKANTERAEIIELARLELLEKQISNNGKVSIEDLKVVLSKYFNNSEIEMLPEYFESMKEEELTSIKGNYKIKVKEIWNELSFSEIKQPDIFIKDIYIGTRAFTVEVNTEGQEINKYYYYIDDRIEESDKPIFTVENLEPESKHSVKVMVENKDGNIKKSNELNITTEPYTYLYLNGNECTEITGGFDTQITSSNSAWNSGNSANWSYIEGNGVYSSATLIKNPENIQFTASHPGQSNYGSTWAFITSKKTIDFSNYKRLYVKGDYNSVRNAGGSSISLVRRKRQR